MKLLNNINIKKQGYQFLIGDWGKEEFKKNREIKFDNKEIKLNLLKEAKNLNISIETASGTFNKNNPCPWPWLGCFIDAEGYVVPCCRIADKTICNFGNIFEENFDNIWNSKGYIDFRKKIASNNIPRFCYNCYDK